jgi:hypothetical protein
VKEVRYVFLLVPTDNGEIIHTKVVLLLHPAEIPKLHYSLKLQSQKQTSIGV